MKTVVAAAVAAGVMASGAVAADYYSAPATPRFGAYSWAGPYVGVNLGYQWGSVTNQPNKPGGIAGGVQGGYNWQNGQFVFGLEADIQATGADDVFAPWKFSNPWFGTLRGRGGVALNNVLLYGTLGLAFGTLRAQSTANGVTQSMTHTGFAAGLGMEVALPGQWTARAEYLYVDLNNRSYSLTGGSHGLESSLLRFGLNYRF